MTINTWISHIDKFGKHFICDCAVVKLKVNKLINITNHHESIPVVPNDFITKEF